MVNLPLDTVKVISDEKNIPGGAEYDSALT